MASNEQQEVGSQGESGHSASVAAKKWVSKTVRPFANLHNLASERLGAEVLYASNEDFAPATNLIKPGRGVWLEHKYTTRGKWMDGWETGRHANATRGGTDYCIIKLGVAGRILGLDIDTNHFTGNFCEFAQVEGCHIEGNPPWFRVNEHKEWDVILPKAELVGGTPDKGHNEFAIENSRVYTHVRLRCYPDGGIARFKVYGVAAPNFKSIVESDGIVDLAGARNGGQIISTSNAFYNVPVNMLLPDRAVNMSDGWETRRVRGYGLGEDYLNVSDWTIVKLGTRGVASTIEVDTYHFVYNFPHTLSLDCCDIKEGQDVSEAEWIPLVAKTPGKGHFQMLFRQEALLFQGPMTHVRINTYPDGGISRLRVFGLPVEFVESS